MALPARNSGNQKRSGTPKKAVPVGDSSILTESQILDEVSRRVKDEGKAGKFRKFPSASSAIEYLHSR